MAQDQEQTVVIDIDDAVLSSVRSNINALQRVPMKPESFTIFRVPAHFRQRNTHLYEPRVVSIGPYGRGDRPDLRAMEQHKWRYLHDFLSRNPKNCIEHYIAEIRELEPRARRCYFEPVELSAEKFVEMLLLDGCFVLEFVIKWGQGDDDSVCTAGWSLPLVRGDLLLLENQIPLFVLEKLFELVTFAMDDQEIPSLMELLVNYLVSRNVERPQEEKQSSHEEAEGVERPEDKIESYDEEAEGIERPEDEIESSDKEVEDVERAEDEIESPHEEAEGVERPEDKIESYDEEAEGVKRPEDEIESSDEKADGVGRAEDEIESSDKEAGGIHDPGLIVPGEAKDFHHLLHLYYRCYVRTPQTDPTESTICGTILKWLNPIKIFASLLSYIRIKIWGQQAQAQAGKKRSPNTIPSATELEEAGVTFKKKDEKKKRNESDQHHTGSFLDVAFHDGVLEIPFLSVENSTLSRFTNLVAFEQCSGCEVEEAYMTSYATFMDCLIDTPADVAILHRRGILENKLASDKELAVFFNQLSECATIDHEKHYLAGLFRDVRKYCDSRWPRWRAKLVRDYFSNPWVIISLIAAVFVLIFTFLQTFYTIFPYYHPRS